MTERDVQLAIFRTIRSDTLVAAPNYTPIRWWECDVWAVTRRGYATEYEIKLTVSDFRADAVKVKEQRVCGKWESQSKFARIGERDGPARFFYVVPEDIRASVEAEIPAFAGLAVVAEGDWRVTIVKHAPRLHSHKIHRREIRLAQNRMWRRYWSLLGRSDEAEVAA